MRVHHLNCGTMTPPVIGRIVCHVLLCETDDGLVLVDTGLGLGDVADHTRIGPSRFLLSARFETRETAAAQVEALGFERSDVRHILITHFDIDHIGGMADFPDAVVHTTRTEFDAATRRATLPERQRYQPAQWAYRPTMERYEGDGESWLGFADAYTPVGLDERFAIIPMPGHSRGHAAVAVDTGDGWLLHAGDAMFHRTSLTSGRPLDPRTLALLGFEQVVAWKRSSIAGNHRRLAELAARSDVDVTVVPAHDAAIFDRLSAHR